MNKKKIRELIDGEFMACFIAVFLFILSFFTTGSAIGLLIRWIFDK